MSCNSKKIFFHVYIVFNRLVEPVAEWTVKVPIHSKLNMFFHKPHVSAFRPHGIQVNRNTARRRGQPRHAMAMAAGPRRFIVSRVFYIYLQTNIHVSFTISAPLTKGPSVANAMSSEVFLLMVAHFVANWL